MSRTCSFHRKKNIGVDIYPFENRKIAKKKNNNKGEIERNKMKKPRVNKTVLCTINFITKIKHSALPKVVLRGMSWGKQVV